VIETVGGVSLDGQLQEALAEFTRRNEALVKARDEVGAISVTAGSKDGAVEVTVGAQGEPTGMRFPQGKYRKMTAEKLASSVLEAMSMARREVTDRAMAHFKSVAGNGIGVAGSGALERLNLDDLLGPLEAEGLVAPRGSGAESAGEADGSQEGVARV
jgi:DNA-binding protein YbaB